MIIKKYNFDEREPAIHFFIINHPEFSNMEGSRSYVMKHTNETTRDKFQLELYRIVNKFDPDDEHIRINIIKYFKEIQQDVPLLTITPRLAINALSSSYADVFPNVYDGGPFPIHTIDYKKMAFVLLWNKNAGTSNHDIRVVKCDSIGNALPDATTPDILVQKNNLNTGRVFSFNFPIPEAFIDFRGFVKIQAKSGNGTDSPILDALFIYLIRGELF